MRGDTEERARLGRSQSPHSPTGLGVPTLRWGSLPSLSTKHVRPSAVLSGFGSAGANIGCFLDGRVRYLPHFPNVIRGGEARQLGPNNAGEGHGKGCFEGCWGSPWIFPREGARDAIIASRRGRRPRRRIADAQVKYSRPHGPQTRPRKIASEFSLPRCVGRSFVAHGA